MYLNGSVEEFMATTELFRDELGVDSRIIDVVNQLEPRIYEKIKGFMLSCFCPKMNCYAYIGVVEESLKSEKMFKNARGGKVKTEAVEPASVEDPDKARNVMHSTIKLADLIIPETNEFFLKFREKAKDSNASNNAQNDAKGGSRREKERKIGEVVIKVCDWRGLYRNRNMTLEDAAKTVGISKKSLDDYFF